MHSIKKAQPVRGHILHCTRHAVLCGACTEETRLETRDALRHNLECTCCWNWPACGLRRHFVSCIKPANANAEERISLILDSYIPVHTCICTCVYVWCLVAICLGTRRRPAYREPTSPAGRATLSESRNISTLFDWATAAVRSTTPHRVAPPLWPHLGSARPFACNRRYEFYNKQIFTKCGSSVPRCAVRSGRVASLRHFDASDSMCFSFFGPLVLRCFGPVLYRRYCMHIYFGIYFMFWFCVRCSFVFWGSRISDPGSWNPADILSDVGYQM